MSQWKHRAFAFELNELELETYESTDVDYSSYTWEASATLIAWLCHSKQAALESANIIELGCGTASVSVAAAKLKLQTDGDHRGQVLATDASFAMDIEARVRATFARNKVDAIATYHHVTWGEPLPSAVTERDWGLVLAADCLYQATTYPLFFATISHLLHLNPNARVVMAHRRRSESRLFEPYCLQFDIQAQVLPLDKHLPAHVAEQYQDKVELWQIKVSKLA
eukprot:TRINITY_DN10702_c0_g1_i3.p1 TRINITY_DN10702_c0_g1~~TRINITY_DN10702_c0_g1_i3.p1  ORF type:complete len:224 (+),score=35.63 TRINITY_DN10702_c0_g1_i3:68-739(+)